MKWGNVFRFVLSTFFVWMGLHLATTNDPRFHDALVVIAAFTITVGITVVIKSE